MLKILLSLLICAATSYHLWTEWQFYDAYKKNGVDTQAVLLKHHEPKEVQYKLLGGVYHHAAIDEAHYVLEMPAEHVPGDVRIRWLRAKPPSPFTHLVTMRNIEDTGEETFYAQRAVLLDDKWTANPEDILGGAKGIVILAVTGLIAVISLCKALGGIFERLS